MNKMKAVILFVSLAMNFFEALFKYPQLFGYAILAGIIIGVLAPLIGSVIIIRRLSFIADTLSHFSLAGVYFGVLLSNMFSFKVNPVVVAVIFSIICTFIIEFLRGFYKNYKELSMPIVMSFGTALSGIFIAMSKSSSDLSSFLFGSIFSISLNDLILIVSLSIVVIGFIVVMYPKIITLCFDETYARISGINTKFLQFLITVILAIFISLFIKIVGVLLISALMIIPVAASILIGKSFKQSVLLAVIFSEVSILLGIYISYTLNLPAGSIIVLFNILILAIVMMINSIYRHGKKKKVELKKSDEEKYDHIAEN